MKPARFCLLPLLLLAACDGEEPDMRPVFTAQAEAASPFVQAYRDGKTQLAGGRPGLAIALFARALAAEPDSVAALNATGIAYDQLRRPDIAQRFYRRALEIEPKAADTLNNLAVSLILGGHPEEARLLLVEAQAQSPSDPIIQSNRGRIALETAQHQVETLHAVGWATPRPHLARSGPATYDLILPRQRPHIRRRRHHPFGVH
jgi:Tfp pilus assembly protein PilF